MRGRVLPAVALFAMGGQAQQLAFSSRKYVEAPVTIAAVQSSDQFGFESLTMENSGAAAVSAVRFIVRLTLDGTDEVAEVRRVALRLEPRESRRVVIEMAHIKGLRDHVRSRGQEAALAVITVEDVEFQDGSEWRKAAGGVHLDAPVDAPLLPKK